MCMKHVAEDEAGQRENQIVESFVHVQCREVQFWSYSYKEPWKHARSLLSIYHVLCSITVILFVRANQSWCHHGSWLSLSFLWWKQWTMFACGGVGRKGVADKPFEIFYPRLGPRGMDPPPAGFFICLNLSYLSAVWITSTKHQCRTFMA